MNRVQPNSLMCFVCGLENEYGLALRFFNTGPDEVTATYIVPDHYQGYPGVVHGGIVAAILDEMAARAQMVREPQHFMVTMKMEISYRRPVPVGQPLKLVGRLLARRGRRATAQSWIYLADGAIAAEAAVLLTDVPAEIWATQPQDLERMGWRVYPDSKLEGSR